MAKKWSEVAASPAFQALSAADQDAARQQYFAEVVAPRVPDRALAEVKDQFDTDTRIRKQDLPADVKPSAAGAGRGISRGAEVASAPAPAPRAPTIAAPTATAAAPTAVSGDPSGADFGAAIMAQQPEDAYIQSQPDSTVTTLERTPPPGITRPLTTDEAIYASRSPENQQQERDRLRYLQGDGSTITALDNPSLVSGALRRLDRKPLDQSLGGAALEVGADAARGLAKAGPGLATAAYGGVEAAADAAGASDIANWAARSAKAGKNYLSKLDNPNGDTLVTGAFQSLGSAAIGGAVAGAEGAALTAFGQTAGEKYTELRAGGLGFAPAVEGAAVHGLAELLGERVGMHSLGRLVEGVAARTGISPLRALKESLIQQGEEQATLAMQTVYDKIGSGTLGSGATLDQYLKDVVDTAAQTAIMTAAAGGAGGVARGAQALVKPTPYDRAALRGFNVEPPLTTDDPVTLVKRRVSAFQNAAAKYGIPPEAVKRAVETAKTLPAEKVGNFLADVAQALRKRDVYKVDPEPYVLDTMRAAPVEPPPEPEKPGEVAKPAEEVAKPTSESDEAVNNIAALLGTPIDEAAHAAAPSPTNDRPEPTQAQKEAGNYAKGHLKLAGLDISIENPEGSTRSGVGADGKEWSNKLNHHYGYIRGTTGADEEQVDTFIKPGATDDNSGPAFIVDQIDPKTGKFDEHKVMLGFDSEQEARDAYESNYAKGWKGLGAITQVDQPALKEWIRSDAAKKPFAPTSELAPDRKLTPVLEQPGNIPGNKAAPATGPRTIGTAGTTPKTATPIELRANEDGTVTPWHDGAELLDYESGDPVRIAADATDQDALEAIKTAGSFGRSTKVFSAAPKVEQPITGFQTAKGSSYTVSGSTTQRTKAARKEHGADQGLKEPSQQTFYVSAEGAQALGEFQAQGGGKRRIVVRSGKAAMQYDDGPSAGKVERRTMTDALTEPAPGLIPVELWKDGAEVHFGNRITKVTRGEASQSATAPTSVAADLEAMRDKDRGYRAPDDVRDAITKAGLSAADKFKDTTWSASVADGRGDLVVEVNPATGNATITGEYMGKPVFTREAKGGAAIGAALDEARAGLEEGERRRKAAQTTKLPAAEAPALPPPPPASSPAAPAEKPKRPGTAQKAASADRNPFKAFLGRRGVSIAVAADFAPGQAERRKAMVPGYGPIFRRTGMQLDELAQRAAEDGFLPPGTQDVAQLTDLIQRSLRGERIAPLYAEGVAEAEMQARAERELQDAEDAALELQALSDEQLTDLDDLWNDRAPPQSTEAAMRALGFSEQEINDATSDRPTEEQAAREGDRGAAAPAAVGSEAGAARREEGPRPAETEGLTSPTPAELEAADQRRIAAETADRKEQKRLADKAKADAERNEFTLTGSDRAADVAASAGQGDIFNAPPAAAPKLPSAAAQERAFANDFAALVGRELVQTVPIAGTSQTATIKIDAAQAMRQLERRERVLRELRDCIGRAA